MTAPQSAERQATDGDHSRTALGTTSGSSQRTDAAPSGTAAAGQLPGDQYSSDTHVSRVAGSITRPAATDESTPQAPARLADPLLYLLAESLSDLEAARIAAENRLRQLTRTETDADGEERGFGLGDEMPVVRTQRMIAEALLAAEHGADLALRRRLREHPLGQWVAKTRGVGPRQGARLIAAVGDPYWNNLHDRPRTVSELWAYSGLHVLPAGGDQVSDPGQSSSEAHLPTAGVAAKRRKGQKSNWSPQAKMRAYLVATSCVKQLAKTCTAEAHVNECQCSPYRIKYDTRRARTAITHPDWTAGHAHNDALRVASKEVLKDLWREARSIHEQDAS